MPACARPRSPIALILAAALLPRCGPQPARTRDASADATSRDARVDRDADAVTRGARLVARNGCEVCHSPPDEADGTLSGQRSPQPGTRAYGANLTPDPETGIGAWSDEEVARAIREGVDPGGEALCAMPHFGALRDDDVGAVVAYLRSLPAVRRAIPPSECAGEGIDAGEPPADAGEDKFDALDDAPLAALDGATDAGPPYDNAPAPCVARVRVNEVQVAGPSGAGDEFVELFNDSDCDAPLAGFALEYAAANGTTASARWRAAATDALPGRGYAVIAGASYDAGPVLGRLSGSAGALAAGGGGLALLDPAGGFVDRVAYGLASTTPLVEDAPAEAPPAGSSIARHPDGADSDHNRADFTVGAPTPGAAN